MMKKTLAVLVITMLVSLFAYPVVAENEVQVTYEQYRLPYGNGQDDDGDGIVDDADEADVIQGTFNVTANTTVFDTWNYTFAYVANATRNVTQPKGVQIGAQYEEFWRVPTSENLSVGPTKHPYYTAVEPVPGTPLGAGNATYQKDSAHNWTNVVTFYVNFSALDIMNGAQEMWYRSPLVWNDSLYLGTGTQAYWCLNIYAVDTGNLVYAGVRNLTMKYLEPSWKQDGSGYNRIYDVLFFPLQTERRYRFEEYIRTQADAPIDEVILAMAPYQDIAGDGEDYGVAFRGTNGSRRLPEEPSWGMLCTIGIGPAGTEKILFSAQPRCHSSEYNRVYADPKVGTIDNVGSLTLIVPIRATKEYNVTIVVTVDGGSGVCDNHPIGISGATGTICETFNITDDDAGNPNTYYIWFEFKQWQTGEVMTYVMYPSEGSVHYIQRNGPASGNEFMNGFAMFIEIKERAADETEVKGTQLGLEALVGLGEILAGLVLLVVSLPVSFVCPLTVLGTVLGSALVIDGVMRMSRAMGWLPENAETLFEALANGAARALKSVLRWVIDTATNLMNIVLEVARFVIDSATMALQYGATILAAIVEIIYFLAFVAVIWFFATFLRIMDHMAHGRWMQMTAAVASTERVVRRRVKQARSDTVGTYRFGVRQKDRGKVAVSGLRKVRIRRRKR